MPLSNRAIINKAANDPIMTSNVAHGMLKPDQAKKFIQQTFDATTLGKEVRHVMRTAKTGEIDKIGIARRIVRGKSENTDDGYRAGINTSVIEYACKAVRLPWEITEETLRENIEGQSFEAIVTDLMTTQLGLDMEDLYLNSDEATDSQDDDYDFLKLNDGWIKQIKAKGHKVDAKTLAKMSLDIFYKALQQLPNKYNNGKLRWVMSPKRQQEWELFLLNQVLEKGGAVPESIYTQPVRIPSISCNNIDDGTILLTDPKNLIVVNSYDVKIRKTTEGKEAIMQDKRFYVCHLDFDPIIEEPDATAIITNLPTIQ